MTSRPPFFNRVVRPAPATYASFWSVASIPPQYAYVLLRSYYSHQRFLFKSCCEKLSKDDRHIALRGKSYCLSGVRPSERPAGLGLFSPAFHASDRSLSRCGAQTSSFFLHTNSLINSSHVGDAFKGMVAWDFAVFLKLKLGSVFSKVPHCWDPLWIFENCFA